MPSARISLISTCDGFRLPAISARADSGARLGAIVVIQEIFGLTDHIAEMAETFAAAGYDVLAPSLYERLEPGFRAGHDAAGVAKGLCAVSATPWPQVAADVQAAIDALPKPCYVTGFCWGGAAAWLASARCTGLAAASCFYGRLISELLDDKPKIPVMLHYGTHDPSIPPDNIERVSAAAPDSPLYLYDAGHGFCRQGSADYNAPASDLAMSRTLDWFARWR